MPLQFLWDLVYGQQIVVNRIRLQFFLSYAVVGCVMPLIGLYLRMEKGLSDFQFSIAMALMSASHLVSPSLFTLLADLRLDSRRVLSLALGIGALALCALWFLSAPALVIAMVTLYGLAQVAMFPLMDGFFFAVASGEKRSPAATSLYPSVRVWGTVGFIVPSLALFFLIRGMGGEVTVVPLLAASLCGAAMFSAAILPGAKRAETRSGDKLPTRKAASALFAGEARWFCLTLALAHAASACYFMFFPLYAVDFAQIPAEWIGLITNYGVVLEIFFTLGAVKLVRVLGMRGVFVAGFLVMAARMLILWKIHHPAVLVAVQTLHGMEIVALYILPAMYLNNLAEDSFRSSIQGVYIMLVSGLAKVIMFPVAGGIAERFGIDVLFLVGGILAVLAAVMAFVKFGGMPAPISKPAAKLPVS